MQVADAEAAHYADSLISLGKASASVPRLKDDLSRTVALFEKNPEVRKFFTDSSIRGEGKRRALEEILGESIHPALLYFLLVLLDDRGLTDLPVIADAFYRRFAGQEGKATGELVTASPLSEERIAAIEEEIGRILGKRVDLRVRVDQSILGGVQVQVGDTVLDGSVDHQLDRVRDTLLA